MSVSVQVAVKLSVVRTEPSVGAVMLIVGPTLSTTATVNERVAAALTLPALSVAVTLTV